MQTQVLIGFLDSYWLSYPHRDLSIHRGLNVFAIGPSVSDETHWELSNYGFVKTNDTNEYMAI